MAIAFRDLKLVVEPGGAVALVVAVALVADHDGLGVRELVPERDRGGATVGGLRVADAEELQAPAHGFTQPWSSAWRRASS